MNDLRDLDGPYEELNRLRARVAQLEIAGTQLYSARYDSWHRYAEEDDPLPTDMQAWINALKGQTNGNS